MSATSFVDLSVVKLKDGRKGTVVMTYDGGQSASIEISGEPQGQIEDVTIEELDSILWTP